MTDAEPETENDRMQKRHKTISGLRFDGCNFCIRYAVPPQGEEDDPIFRCAICGSGDAWTFIGPDLFLFHRIPQHSEGKVCHKCGDVYCPDLMWTLRVLNPECRLNGRPSLNERIEAGTAEMWTTPYPQWPYPPSGSH